MVSDWLIENQGTAQGAYTSGMSACTVCLKYKDMHGSISVA